MSCFNTYNNYYKSLPTDEKTVKPLGTLADDYTSNACIVPASLVNLFVEKAGTSSNLSMNDCKLKMNDDVLQLEKPNNNTGCRIDFASIQDISTSQNILKTLQAVYDKNVIDEINKLNALLIELKNKNNQLINIVQQKQQEINGYIQTYNTESARSNQLNLEHTRLSAISAANKKRLRSMRTQIFDMIKTDGNLVGELNSKIDIADYELDFVTVYEHCDFNGRKQILEEGIYAVAPNVNGISSIVVPPGMSVKIFEKPNFEGHNATLTRNNSSTERSCLLNVTYLTDDTTIVEGFKGHGKFFSGKKTGNGKAGLLGLGLGIGLLGVAGGIALGSKKPLQVIKLPKINNFNDRVGSIEVQKVQSVSEFIDKWNLNQERV